MQEIMAKLQAPFKAEEIEWRVGSTNKDKSKGLALAYVTNRAMQNRLDDVFGVFGWQNEFKEWRGNSQICGISIWDEDKAKWITKWDGADDSQTEAVKGGLSDSMKRAAYQWGIGRYLYNLPQTWVALKDGKYIITEPTLPAWALPQGTPPAKAATIPKNTLINPADTNPGQAQQQAQQQVKAAQAIIANNTTLLNQAIADSVLSPALKAETTAAEKKATAKKDKPDFIKFYAQCDGLGYNRKAVHEYTKCDSLRDWTREQLFSLFKELQAVKANEMEGK